MNEIALRSVAKYQVEHPERFNMGTPLQLTVPKETTGCIAGNTCILYIRDRAFRQQCDEFLKPCRDVDIARLQYYLLLRSRHIPSLGTDKRKLYPLWKDTSAFASALLGLSEEETAPLFYFPLLGLISDDFPERSRLSIRYLQAVSSLERAEVTEEFIEAFIRFIDRKKS